MARYYGNYYSLDEDMLDVVIACVQDTYPHCTSDDVIGIIDSDWAEGKEHQQWLDESSPQEIARWVGEVYWNEIQEEMSQ
jgi:hypothetical protein